MPLKSNLSDLAPSRARLAKDITLLSRGYYAPQHFPDGKIKVFPWDNSVDEFIIERAEQPERQHTLMYDLFPKLCDLKGCPRNLFVVSEVFLVVMVARAIGRGGNLVMNLTCPSCKHAWSQELSVPEHLEKVGEKPVGYNGNDPVTLPVSQDVVVTRPLNVGDELAIIERSPERRAEITDAQARRIAAVVSVGGGVPDDYRETHAWLNALDPRDVKALNMHLSETSPHLRQQIEVECDQCKKPGKHALRIESEFFRSGSFRLDGSTLVQAVPAGS